MTSVDDLVAWLTQIWDEQEALAKAATPSPWKWQDPGPPHKMALLGDNGRLMIVPSRTPDVYPSVHDGDFIAANDPASVLARIAADRQILALHEPYVHEGIGMVCGCCAGGAGANAQWPCETICLMAQPYAERPGWQEAWRVTP